MKDTIATAQPYEKWVEENLLSLKKLPDASNQFSQPSPERLLHRQQAFGVSTEEVNEIIVPMANDAKEPLSAMGADWYSCGSISSVSTSFKLLQATVRTGNQPTDRPDP